MPANFLFPQRELQNANNKYVVRPNADTLYGFMVIDISEKDLEVTVPDFGDRFGVVPFYDLYGNNFANIGSVANSTHGTFKVCYDQENIGVSAEVGDGDYDGRVGMPTPYGLVLARIVTDNSTEDLDAVHSLQDQIKVKAVERSGPAIAPRLNTTMFKNPFYIAGHGTSMEEAVLRLTAALAPYNEPEVAADREWVAQKLKHAGIENGKWIQPLGTNLTATSAAANQSATALLETPGYLENLSSNWTAFDPRIIGDYHSYYQARYLITAWAYLAMTSHQAVYPTYPGPNGIGDDFSIGADQAYLFQFSRRPVLKEQGFWSLTVYGPDQFFIPNELNRYSLGDRSNLTFPDGTLVYADGNGSSTDGPFEILLQPADVTPPDNWTSNWLPAPVGGGPLSFTSKFAGALLETTILTHCLVRWYGAEDEMTEGGSYEYPKVSVIDAIRA